MKYPKINTIWKRDKKTHKIREGEFSCPEFEAINRWHISEKVAGMNIRIIWDLSQSKNSQFKGKTDEAQIPSLLLFYLEKNFSYKIFEKQFPEAKKVVLYGEGYGSNIQSVGRLYRKDNAFILFDAWIDGWWLEPNSVKKLATELGIDYVPTFGIRTTLKAISFIRGEPKSCLSEKEVLMEGIVARSVPLMQFRDEKQIPIMWKLKAKDYRT